MTYKERFGNAKSFGKFTAQRRLDLYDKYGAEYYNGNCKVNLLTYSECYMSSEMKKAKEKALADIEYLKKVVKGEIVDPYYTYYYEHFKDEEYPSWR